MPTNAINQKQRAFIVAKFIGNFDLANLSPPSPSTSTYRSDAMKLTNTQWNVLNCMYYNYAVCLSIRYHIQGFGTVGRSTLASLKSRGLIEKISGKELFPSFMITLAGRRALDKRHLGAT